MAGGSEAAEEAKLSGISKIFNAQTTRGRANMPGAVCAIASCKNNPKKAKQSGEKISFFTFPKDEKVKEEWVKRCNRKNTFNPLTSRICSKHFTIYAFEDGLKSRIMNTTPIKLRRDALPTLLLPPPPGTENEEASKSKQKKSKPQFNVEERTESPVKAEDSEGEIIVIDVETETSNSNRRKKSKQKQVGKVTETSSLESTPERESSTETPFEILEKKFASLAQENEKIKNELKKQSDRLVDLQNRLVSLEQKAQRSKPRPTKKNGATRPVVSPKQKKRKATESSRALKPVKRMRY